VAAAVLEEGWLMGVAALSVLQPVINNPSERNEMGILVRNFMCPPKASFI
jgi:hypothetical protein